MSLFPFDSSGTATANKIVNEDHVITTVSGTLNNYIKPLNAPFYGTTLAIIDKATGETLVEDVDYKLTHKYQEAIDNIALDVYGTITISDLSRNGTFSLNYQTLGGDMVDASTQALNNGMEALANLLIVDWSQIANVPLTFPSTPHNTSVTDIDAMNQVIDQLILIGDNLENPYRDLKFSDISDLNTEWRQPILDGFGAIAAAITAKVNASSLPFEQGTPGRTPTSVGSVVNGQWTDTPLVCQPSTNGTYMINMDVNYEAVGATGAYALEKRFVVNGSVIDRSYSNHSAIGLSASDVVMTQVRLVGSNSTNLKVADSNFSSTISILRIGN